MVDKEELLRKLKSEEISTDELVDFVAGEGLKGEELHAFCLEVVSEALGVPLAPIKAGWEVYKAEMEERRATGQLEPITGLKSPRRRGEIDTDSNSMPPKFAPKLEAPREFSYPRTAFGRKLRVSPETKKAWKELTIELSWDEWQEKATKFLQTLNRDLWMCPHYHKSAYCKCGSRVLRNTPWGIHRCAPRLKVRIINSMTGTIFGRYGIDRRGHGLDINPNQRVERRNKTLLHEVIHWIGSLGVEQSPKRAESRRYGSHTPAFWLRMKELGEQLGFEFEIEFHEMGHGNR